MTEKNKGGRPALTIDEFAEVAILAVSIDKGIRYNPSAKYKYPRNHADLIKLLNRIKKRRDESDMSAIRRAH